MSEKKRFGMTLSMSDPLQRQAWEILNAVPERRRTAAVCKALCGTDRDRNLLDAFRTMLREELRNVRLAPAPEQITPDEPEECPDGETQEMDLGLDDRTISFLRSLTPDEE